MMCIEEARQGGEGIVVRTSIRRLECRRIGAGEPRALGGQAQVRSLARPTWGLGRNPACAGSGRRRESTAFSWRHAEVAFLTTSVGIDRPVQIPNLTPNAGEFYVVCCGASDRVFDEGLKHVEMVHSCVKSRLQECDRGKTTTGVGGAMAGGFVIHGGRNFLARIRVRWPDQLSTG